jgi:hypothetical protein
MDTNTPQKINITDVYRMRISHIVEKLMQDNGAFQERLDKTEVINEATQSMQEKFPLKQFLAIEDSDLKLRLGQRMAIQGLYGLIADLSQEQIQAFDDAVARR